MRGLRHAFDADHIAAVEDNARYLLQQGQRSLGLGFFRLAVSSARAWPVCFCC
jgi:high-affinity nickel permease